MGYACGCFCPDCHARARAVAERLGLDPSGPPVELALRIDAVLDRDWDLEPYAVTEPAQPWDAKPARAA
jgi:hypothetical protein